MRSIHPWLSSARCYSDKQNWGPSQAYLHWPRYAAAQAEALAPICRLSPTRAATNAPSSTLLAIAGCPPPRGSGRQPVSRSIQQPPPSPDDPRLGSGAASPHDQKLPWVHGRSSQLVHVRRRDRLLPPTRVAWRRCASPRLCETSLPSLSRSRFGCSFGEAPTIGGSSVPLELTPAHTDRLFAASCTQTPRKLILRTRTSSTCAFWSRRDRLIRASSGRRSPETRTSSPTSSKLIWGHSPRRTERRRL